MMSGMTANPKDRIGRRIKLRDLHILLAIAERGSLIKAAHDLSISPPVISKAIADLEAAVGARLFDRDRQARYPRLSAAHSSIAASLLSMSCAKVSRSSSFWPIPLLEKS